MKCLVTGAAGFIGSTLSEKLLEQGHEVVGIDCFVPYYPKEIKEANLARALGNDRYTFLEKDICDVFADGGAQVLDGVSAIFHQAAQAGVRASWGRDFDIYAHNNIMGSQMLLEACKKFPDVKVVYASSSSVYGETNKFPMNETDRPQPVSPYGVSKLAAEHLMKLYHVNFGVKTVSLRYFTVYGPRQRPDMAFHRIIRSILTGQQFHLFGTGEQTRDFTYIDDIVQSNIEAAEKGHPGGVYNIGGGTRVSMNQVIEMIEELAGKKAHVIREARQLGDVTNTGADVTRAETDFQYCPLTGLREGLAREIDYVRDEILAKGIPPT